MKQLATGTSTEYDLYTAALPGVLVRLDGSGTDYADSGVAHRIIVEMRIGAGAKPLNGSGTLTVTPKIGPTGVAARTVLNQVKTGIIDAAIVQFQIDPLTLTVTNDTLRVYLHSDNASDTDVTVVATVMEVIVSDTNGRHDVSLVGGATPMSTTDIRNDSVKPGLQDYELDHLVSAACDSDTITNNVVDDSIVAKVLTNDGDISDYAESTDSQEAIRDKLTDIETDTAEIGTAGAGLTDLGGMSTGMKGEVNAEVDTALNTAVPGSPTADSINERVKAVDDKLPSKSYIMGSADSDGGFDAEAKADVNTEADTALSDINLDHLMKTAVANNADMTTEVTDGTVLSNIMTKGSDTSDFTVADDSLEGIRDHIVDSLTEGQLNTTVGATVTDATTFNLAAGVSNDDAYIDATICVMDNSNSSFAEWRTITDYTGATKTVVLDRALSFTPEASTDEVIIQGKTRNNAVAGGSANTYTVTDDGTAQGNAVPDVHVWVTTDSAGNTIVADGQSDSNGQCVFYLDAGKTYYIWKHKAGYTFEAQPETVTAS